MRSATERREGRGGIRWGLNLFLLVITLGLWVFALPWWPRHRSNAAEAAELAKSREGTRQYEPPLRTPRTW